MQDAARLLERVLGTGPAPGSNKGHLELGAEQVVVLGRVHLRQQARRVRRRVHAGVRHKQVDEVRRHGVGAGVPHGRRRRRERVGAGVAGQRAEGQRGREREVRGDGRARGGGAGVVQGREL